MNIGDFKWDFYTIAQLLIGLHQFPEVFSND